MYIIIPLSLRSEVTVHTHRELLVIPCENTQRGERNEEGKGVLYVLLFTISYLSNLSVMCLQLKILACGLESSSMT